MPVKLQGLEDNARKTSISELQACMSDGLSLSMALKQAHWNVKGPNFIAVHELLDAIKLRLDPNIDEFAERIFEAFERELDLGEICWTDGEGNEQRKGFGIMSGMKLCPPKPGSTVITSTIKSLSRYGSTASGEVPGLMAKAGLTPRSSISFRVRSTSLSHSV